MTRTLVALLRAEIEVLLLCYKQCAETAHGSATVLLGFLINNRKYLVDY